METSTTLHSIPPPPSQTTTNKVALVSMPWASVHRASVAIAILKPCIEAAGFSPDVHLLNIQLAAQIGLTPYQQVAQSSFYVEWLFAQLLFGPKGLNEIANDWTDLKSNPSASGLLNLLKESFNGSEELCARVANHDIPKFIDDCARQVDWSQYLAVGFTTTFAQSLASLALAKRIKEAHPEVRIVFGGANVDSEMGVEFVRGFPWVDFVVHGEAEHSFPALLKKIAAKDEQSRIPGVSMRRNGELVRGDLDATPLKDLNESPTPDYTDYVRALERSQFNKKFQMWLYFESSRGCWWGAKHHCTFCGLNGSTMAYRKKDSTRVYSEIIELSKKYHCLKFSATDNILAMEYFSELLPRLADDDLDFSLFYEVKANLSREQLNLLQAAGVKEIQPGIESLNSRILKLMRKGATAIQNLQLLKWCDELGIFPDWNLLYGFPGETAEDYHELPQHLLMIAHLAPPQSLIQVMFERFSPYFFDREKFGLELSPWAGYQFIFPESRVDLNKIAYIFDGEWDRSADPDDYILPVRDVYNAWKLWRQENKVFCYYEKGPDYLMIHDNRPNRVDAPLKHRQLYLKEPVAELYLFCDERRSFKSICKVFEEKFPNSGGPDKIRIWLDQLVAQRVMFKEEEQYLSLAVRKKKRHGKD